MTRILITGANRGIGLAMCGIAIKKGWTVFGSVRQPDQAARLADQLPGLTPIVFDVCDHAAVKKAAEAFDGPLDVLVNNAGIIGPDRQSTLDTDFEGFRRTLEVNTLAPLAASQAFLPALKRSSNGRIVTISSRMGSMDYTKSNRIAYRASKAAVNKVMQGLATDLHDSGIAVAIVHPGWVRTDMGGSDADISAEEAGSGILKIAETLAMHQSGTFYEWNGEEHPF